MLFRPDSLKEEGRRFRLAIVWKYLTECEGTHAVIWEAWRAVVAAATLFAFKRLFVFLFSLASPACRPSYFAVS